MVLLRFDHFIIYTKGCMLKVNIESFICDLYVLYWPCKQLGAHTLTSLIAHCFNTETNK